MTKSERPDSSAPTASGSSLGVQLRQVRPLPSGLHQARIARLFGRRVFHADRKIEIIRRIGGGAMGTVYEARYAGSRVALKVLNQLAPQQIYGLKKEFRMLASIAHPNVVTAYHLFADEDTWYFTMELVEGHTLSEAWRSYARDARAEGSPWEPALDGRLRTLVRQLVDGVIAMHRAGLVHRDLKPANVLVSSTGRLVIVDFGLVSTEEEGGIGQTVEHMIAGTPAYMAPEQARGSPASQASDWYAVGLMLYELLTARLPETQRLMPSARGPTVAHAPSEHDPSVPADLDALCRALTDPNPARRPTSEQMTELCASWQAPRGVARFDWAPRHRGAPLVGREPELALLREARADATRARPVWVLVEGDSGVGKSALLRELAARLRASPQAVVLEGSCTEQELLPHRGIDSLIDQLARHLLRLAPEQAAQLVPRHAAALTQLFPVLLRVPALRMAATEVAPPEQAELVRARALEALRELFCRIADRRPLTLMIDDLHWADVQSLDVLCELVSAPEPPQLLLVAAHRRSAAGRLDALAERLPEGTLRQLVLPKLAEQDAEQLAAFVLADAQEPPSPAALSAAIAREADGVPLYVAELAASARARELEGLDADPSMRELLQAQIARLPARARKAFDMLVVAGRPLPSGVLARATDLCDLHQPLASLRKARLTREVEDVRGPATDVYHHRVRDACLSLMNPATLCECRSQLARALASETEAEPAWVAELFASIGERAEAAQKLLALAREAEQGACFEQAAKLIAQAAAWLEPTVEAGRLAELHQQRSQLLASAGCAGESARALSRAIRLYAESDQLGRACRVSLSSLHQGSGSDALHVLERALERLSLAWPLRPRKLGFRFRQG